jgi:hypothetical protein
MAYVSVLSARVRASAEKREAGLRQPEHPLHVQREHFAPRRIRVLVDSCSPRRTRVVNEHVKLALAGGELADETL